MIQSLTQDTSIHAIPMTGVSKESLSSVLNELSPLEKKWLESMGFEGWPRTLCIIPNNDHTISHVLYGMSEDPYEQMWDPAFLARALPKEFVYHFAHFPSSEMMALTWALGGYNFHVSANKGRSLPTLLVDTTINLKSVEDTLTSIEWVRTLINCPSNILHPQALADEAKTLAKTFGATITEIIGQDLLTHHYPLLYAVGRTATAKEFEPRMIRLEWGNPSDFHTALIGKGITFDTGGLNLKTGNYMDLMKKDMGGAALVLGLARWVMSQELPLHLSVYIPIAENGIGTNAMRPGDIIKSREGLTVEITDTDAEGRLILADALSAAAEEDPDVMLDFSTLTGAARVALGPDIPVFFVSDSTYQDLIRSSSKETMDALWSLPLWDDYADGLKSTVADLKNTPPSSLGGSITAALFLKRFTQNKPWVHVDLMAWNVQEKPGRPVGGEAQSFRAFCTVLKKLASGAMKKQKPSPS